MICKWIIMLPEDEKKEPAGKNLHFLIDFIDDLILYFSSIRKN